MLWLLPALATALLNASAATITKRHFSDMRPWEIGMIPHVHAGLFCLPLLLFIETPPLGPAFWWAWGLSLPLLLTALFFQYRAIQLSPLSLTMPYLSFTPAFVILTGFLILGEVLNLWGLAGVLAIVLGGYVLNLEPGAGRGPAAPIRAVLREPGSWRMLVTAVVFSLCGVLGRLGVLHSSPLFFALTLFPALGLAFLLVGLATGRARLSCLVVRPGWALLAGLCLTLEITAHHAAIAMVKAAYMLAVKRLNTLFSVIYGGVVFKESNIRIRLAGTILMLAGVVLIALLGR